MALTKIEDILLEVLSIYKDMNSTLTAIEEECDRITAIRRDIEKKEDFITGKRIAIIYASAVVLFALLSCLFIMFRVSEVIVYVLFVAVVPALLVALAVLIYKKIWLKSYLSKEREHEKNATAELQGHYDSLERNITFVKTVTDDFPDECKSPFAIYTIVKGMEDYSLLNLKNGLLTFKTKYDILKNSKNDSDIELFAQILQSENEMKEMWKRVERVKIMCVNILSKGT